MFSTLTSTVRPQSLVRRAAFTASALVLVATAATGCASKEDLLAERMRSQQFAESLTTAQRDAETQKARADALASQLARIQNGDQGRDNALDIANQRIAELARHNDDLQNRYANLVNNIGTGPALPEPLTNELDSFAKENPNVVTFDADRGIVKFKSDVTFQSGDAALTSEAKSVITDFARILNGPVARNYELRVAGHTDNVPVSSELTKKKGHLDNWYLSAHRAISVSKELKQSGINPQRMGVLGFADQRPTASNDDTNGRAQNRRVEVLILPNTVNQAATIASESNLATPASGVIETNQPVTTEAPITGPSDAGVDK